MPASKTETRARKLPSNVWRPGQSGNPHGRPKAPVDIAELARQHGPRCIAVAASLLEDADPRIRLGALVALLDRGFGKPRQAVEINDPANSLMLHWVAAKRVSEELQEELQRRGRPTIEADAVEMPPEDLLSAPLPEE
jgi:hypothetical protein